MSDLSPLPSLSFSSESMTDTTSSSLHLMIPIPGPDNSQASFVMPKTAEKGVPAQALSKEAANADISMAPDGSFVETSSGEVAFELKRIYDDLIGVNPQQRSPYAITAFVNQHGKQMYRVSRRDMAAPAKSGQDADLISPTSSTSSSLQERRTTAPNRRKRKSRMSVHTFLNPVIFKPNSPPSKGVARSPTNSKKLRKSRSIPDMYSLTSPSTSTVSASTKPTGRGHSHSVTSADMLRLPVPDVGSPIDLFGDLDERRNSAQSLQVGSSSSSSSNFFDPDTPGENSSSDNIIAEPFGHGVTFDSPSLSSQQSRHNETNLAMPRLLREMQSFESVMTARQTDIDIAGDDEDEVLDIRRPPSVVRLRPETPQQPPPDPPPLARPAPETAMYSRYSTDVFDVLQTYSGIPLVDKLSPDAGETTVIKLSLATDGTAAPRDDPRFVIWGSVSPSNVGNGSHMTSQSDLSSARSSSATSSSRRHGSRSIDVPKVRLPASPNRSAEVLLPLQQPKVLLAATIERWIAQLTSDLDYDELLIFFLTYRTYLSALDLCHLLICRFHWALQESTTQEDELVRRIVRVRTFVAIRYWLLTFFAVDFLPDRELRLTIADWLNTLIRDPILVKHRDGLIIVRKLRKVAKDCKKMHTRIPADPPKDPQPKPGHLLQSLTKVPREDDSDVDLDFSPIHGVAAELAATDPANCLTHVGAGVPAVTIPVSSLGILQRPDVFASGYAGGLTYTQTSAMLPMHHSALSRAFVKTIGRIGRWKRVLNSRAAVRPPVGTCADGATLDLEQGPYRDVLSTRGGVERYMKAIADSCRSNTSHGAPTPPLPTTPKPLVHPDLTRVSSTLVGSFGNGREASLRSSSTDSLGAPLSSGQFVRAFNADGNSQWRFDAVSIDDLDLSDNSDDETPAAPPGLRQPTRKLPLRRDFEFVRRDSVSSMGFSLRDSMDSAAHLSRTSSAGGEEDVTTGPIQPWHMSALADSLSDDEEAGDVETALRRLEGQVSPQIKDKASKVHVWVESIKKRHEDGEYIDDMPRDSIDDLDDAERESDTEGDDTSITSHDAAAPLTPGSEQDVAFATTSIATHSPYATSEPSGASFVDRQSSVVAKPEVEDAVPAEIIDSHIMSPTTLSKFVDQEIPRSHRSFVLYYRSSTLVEHFSMIDRELFIGMKFVELISDDWLHRPELIVLDWTQYLKDRARWKAESVFPEKTSALAAVRARHLLVTNFTISEIVLTQPNERPAVTSKFIRIAWKAYLMKNFNILMAILMALDSAWVHEAMANLWNRMGIWETRMLSDLKMYATPEGEYKYIRRALESIADSKPVETSSHPPSVGNGSSTDGRTRNGQDKTTAACIPYLDVYLSQLRRYSELPDLIDPTAPHEAVGIDPINSNFSPPAHPKVFATLAPLPPSMHLEPLINVQKQRLVAAVIKSLVAGQHMVNRIHYPIERELYHQCRGLRGLSDETLRRALAMYK
ncbi:ras GEF [Fistulina hepatica ATCC 64428]|uniref:Ras GEF n=1 Tax=Fistulina hepatica ATCC 64428 TaxID=1128425 RepID=A0A0D7A3D9_9AGAR|nr:ras GEF [Fistulina hepatica ATCC 64428]